MIILTIRTDRPEAEVGLYDDDKKLAYETWQAHRQLAETLHRQIARNLQSVGKDWDKIEAIVVFKGPGSFTGLRIGLTVGNALANSLKVLIVGETGEDWIAKGIKKLQKGQNEKIIIPEYGGSVYITTPRK